MTILEEVMQAAKNFGHKPDFALVEAERKYQMGNQIVLFIKDRNTYNLGEGGFYVIVSEEDANKDPLKIIGDRFFLTKEEAISYLLELKGGAK